MQFNLCKFLCFLLFSPSFIHAQVENNLSIHMAESVILRHPGVYGDWDYVTGTVLRGFQSIWEVNEDPQYFEYIKNTTDFSISSNGAIAGYNMSTFNIDEIKQGSSVLFLYEMTGDERYRTAANTLRTQMDNHPRTSDGGFWHKKKYPHQMWLDGLYMGSPFLAHYGHLFNQPEYINDALRQIILMDKHAYDPNTELYFHGWDESKEQEWADPESGCSPSFWGRAIGWYAMAIVDVLDFVPESHSKRDSVVMIMNKLASGAKRWQDEGSGLWYQVVDKADSTGNYRESSVSSMFCYSIAKAVRKGYLNSSYLEVAQKAYDGILEEFISTNQDQSINLDKTCATAGLGYGRDGTYHYYIYETYIRSNDGKGIGPFISAAVEMENLLYPPTQFRFDSIETSALTISWKDNSVHENGFVLRKKMDESLTELISIESNETSFRDELIDYSTLYEYEVAAIYGTDTSSFTGPLKISTAQPDGRPGLAFDPFPGNNVTNADPDLVLEWISGATTKYHKLYFGTEENPQFVSDLNQNRFNPGLLSYETAYFWRVDEVNDYGITTGETWKFSTKAPPEEKVAHWSFDEENTYVMIDSSSYEHHGIMQNFSSTSIVEGVNNSGLEFNGDDQQVYVSNSEDLNFGAGSFSISMWLKISDDSYEASKQSRYLIKGSHIKNPADGNSGKRYEIFHHAYSNEIRFSIDDDSIKSVVKIADSLVIKNNWVHLVALRDVVDKKVKIYIDGELAGSSEDNTGNISQVEPLYLGYCEDYPKYFKGVIDEVFIFSKALSEEEIDALFNNMVISNFVIPTKQIYDFTVHPNPCSDYLIIESLNELNQDLSVKIVDMKGQTHYADRLISKQKAVYLKKELGLSAGTYVLCFFYDGKLVDSKFINVQ